MTHKQAMELAEQHGGSATHSVSKQTTMLVVGEEGWPLEEDGKPSAKLQQVTEWRQQGLDIKLLQESEWLHLIGLEERRRDVHRLLTPAMLSQSLKVSVGLIRHWERIGLIKPLKKVFRLPYFDFREVACVRRLSELLQAGVPQHELEASLSKLQAMLPGTERSLAQLTLLARDQRVVLRDATGIVEPMTRQRLFDFDEQTMERLSEKPDFGRARLPPSHVSPQFAARQEPRPPDSSHTATDHSALNFAESQRHAEAAHQNWSAQDWLQQGSQLLEEGRVADSIEALRLALLNEPTNPETHFHLAEALYRSGNLAAALERFHVAVELDQNYLEAWTQLGCVAAELDQAQSALDAFDIALHSHADYPDAHFHKAELLHRLDRREEARPHWQAYLEHDQRGPWADVARQRLGEPPPISG
jgi:tetratricopeptide (TPR) repeat protein